MRYFVNLLFLLFCSIFLNSNPSYSQVLPDISNLSPETQSSIKIACVVAKTEGPASYGSCISKQFFKLSQSAGIPDISNLSSETQSSIKIACVVAKTEGPASYGSCISKQLAGIGVLPTY